MMRIMKTGKGNKSEWIAILLMIVLFESCCLFSLIWHQWPQEEEIEIIGF